VFAILASVEEKPVKVQEAIQFAMKKFPFPGYLNPQVGARGAYSNIANTVLRHLKPGSKILDFGCGSCDKISILQSLGYKCSGYDDLKDEWHLKPGNREKIISFARECGIDFKLAQAGPLPFEKAFFDMVMLHDVLEHLRVSPRELLNDLLELANAHGLLFVTVPNAANIRKRIAVLTGKTNLPPYDGYYWSPVPWRGHVRKYVKDDLMKLAGYLDLEVLELRGCDHMLSRLSGAARPAYILLTGIFNAWKDSWLLVARKKSGWAPRKSLSPEEHERILGDGESPYAW
jgi:SAM-dependent methyltransferase